jgi:hypothetical protein
MAATSTLGRALAKTSADLNILTTETIFNRGVPLLPDTTYFPVFSSLSNGAYGTHVITPFSAALYQALYGQTSFPDLIGLVSSISTQDAQVSSVLGLDVSTLQGFSNSTMITFAYYYNVGFSTVTSFSNQAVDALYFANINSNTTVTLSNTVMKVLNNQLDLTSSPVNIICTMFTPLEIQTFQHASSLYGPGGSNNVGPGISTMYSTSQNVYYSTLVNQTYPAVLSNTSSTWGYFQASTISTVNAISTLTKIAKTFIDGGSSISTNYVQTFSTLNRMLATMFYGPNVSTMSTIVYRNYANMRVPELSTAQNVFSNSMNRTQSTYSSLLISTFTASSFFISPFLVTSNAMSTTYGITSNSWTPYNQTKSVSSLAFQESTILAPFIEVASVSTNVQGYKNLSSIMLSSLSSFSSQFPVILGSSMLATVDYTNKQICSVSTTFGIYGGTNVSSFKTYVTGPGVSSMNTFFQSSFVSYSNAEQAAFDTVLTSFIQGFAGVDSRPGLSSMYVSAGSSFITMYSNSTAIHTYNSQVWPSQFSSYIYPQYQYNDTVSTVNSHTGEIVSTVGVFSTISSYVAITSTILQTQGFLYISAAGTAPDGYLYSTVAASSFATLPAQASTLIQPFLGSTIFFNEIPNPSDYSTFTDPLYQLLPRAEGILGISTLPVNGRVWINQTEELSAPYTFNTAGAARIIPEQTSNVFSFAVGNNQAGIFLYSNDYPSVDRSTLRYVDTSFNLVPGAFGATVNPGSLLVPVLISSKFFYNEIRIADQYVTPPLTNDTTQLRPFYSTNFSMISPTTPLEFFQVSPSTFVFSQFNETARTNTLVYEGTSNPSMIPGNSLAPQATNMPSATDPRGGSNFASMGPMTSITNNGAITLLTAIRTPLSNYTDRFNATWAPTIIDKYYTLAVLSNLNFSTLGVGNGTFSTLLYLDSHDAIPTSIHDAIWTGQTWVAAGDGVLTSRDGLAWTRAMASTGDRLLRYTSLDYNGDDILMAYFSTMPNYLEILKSSDGAKTWTHASTLTLRHFNKGYTLASGFPDYTSTTAYSAAIKWGYGQWNMIVTPGDQRLEAPSTLFYVSKDGSNWLGSTLGRQIVGDVQTLNVTLEPTEAPGASLALPRFAVYAYDGPNSNYTDHTLATRFSTITFNHGALTLKRVYNSQIRGYMGVNNLYPSGYTLDIGFGDARKPGGGFWLTSSDERIKSDICTSNPEDLVSTMNALHLMEYSLSDEYAEKHGVHKGPMLGFISQDVKKVLPNAVTTDERDGLVDFQSLDTDQLFKIKFGVTRHLLERAAALEARLAALT